MRVALRSLDQRGPETVSVRLDEKFHATGSLRYIEGIKFVSNSEQLQRNVRLGAREITLLLTCCGELQVSGFVMCLRQIFRQPNKVLS